MMTSLTPQDINGLVPPWLWRQLLALHRQLGGELYLAGGVVRDLLLGHRPQDIDLTVNRDARIWASRLASCSGGALVPLGRDEDAARVVIQGVTVDFSAFRLGAKNIVDDLGLRDLSINAMAVRIDPLWVRGGGDGQGQTPPG